MKEAFHGEASHEQLALGTHGDHENMKKPRFLTRPTNLNFPHNNSLFVK